MNQLILSLFVAFTLFSFSTASAESFNHGDHLGYLDGEPCMTCHVEGAESIRPDTSICLECHETELIDNVSFAGLTSHDTTWSVSHRAAAKGSAMNCAACHQQDDCLECHGAGFADEMGSASNGMINVHRSDFSVTHPIEARTNPQRCASCHENRFCVECHDSFNSADLAIKSHRRSFSEMSGNTIAHENFDDSQCQTCHTDSVLPSHQWSNSHAREARKNLATCQACHPEGQVCLKCHSAISGLRVSPHPKDWNDMDGRLYRASNGRTCRQCH